MKDFYCAATDTTPEIKGDIVNREISINGKCYPANSREFFAPFRTWLDAFLKSETSSDKLEFDLEYFNTSSSLILLEIMKQFNKKNEAKQMVWLYDEEDDDMIEAGNEYNLLIGNKLVVQEKCSLRA